MTTRRGAATNLCRAPWPVHRIQASKASRSDHWRRRTRRHFIPHVDFAPVRTRASSLMLALHGSVRPDHQGKAGRSRVSFIASTRSSVTWRLNAGILPLVVNLVANVGGDCSRMGRRTSGHLGLLPTVDARSMPVSTSQVGCFDGSKAEGVATRPASGLKVSRSRRTACASA
jgi:hypothetical protein